MRLFIGIPLAAEMLDELTKVVTRLRSTSDGLRWTAPESWHITLQFLGNSGPEQYDCIVARLAEVRSNLVPVDFGELGFFERAGVFFADVLPTPALLSLAAHVAAVTSLCGFVSETRPFHPHITLARVTGKSKAQSRTRFRTLQERIHPQPVFSRFLSSEFCLYESHLFPTGSTYEVRHRFRFQQRGLR